MAGDDAPDLDAQQRDSLAAASRLLGDPRVAFAIDRVLIPGMFLVSLVAYLRGTSFPSSAEAAVDYVLNIARYSIVPIFLLASRKALEARLSWRGLVGIVLSVAGPILFDLQAADTRWGLRGPNAPVFEVEHAMSITIVGTSYTLMLIGAYFNLGRNLSVTPMLKSVVTHGLYSVVRHPVYAATLHMAAIFTLVYPSLLNFFCLLCLNVGLHLRMTEEEIVLSADESYVEYLQRMKHRTYSPIVSSPLVFLVTLRLMSS